MNEVEQVRGPARELPEQHQRHGPAMLGRAHEQPEEGGRIEEDQAKTIGYQHRAWDGVVTRDRSIQSDPQLPPYKLRIIRADQEQAQERRDGQQDQVAAGQPAPGIGIFQGETGTGCDRRYLQGELELVPRDFHAWRNGGGFEDHSQQPEAAKQRADRKRQRSGHVAAPPTVQADGGQQDGATSGGQMAGV